jgi:hypothetical protein
VRAEKGALVLLYVEQASVKEQVSLYPGKVARAERWFGYSFAGSYALVAASGGREEKGRGGSEEGRSCG